MGRNCEKRIEELEKSSKQKDKEIAKFKAKIKRKHSMVRVSFILILIAGMFGNSFCQDSIFTKKRWQVEGGVNMLIPIRNYTEEFSYDHYFGKFDVKPNFTANNFFVDFNYRHTYYKKGKKSFFGTRMDIGYEHLTRKQEKEGYCYGYGKYFEGTKITTEKVDYLFLEFALNHNFLVKKKAWITNQIDFEFDFSLNLIYLNLKYSGYMWWGPSLNMTYQLQATVPLNNRIMLVSGFEIPLLIQMNYRTSPWLSSPYTSSREKFAFILFRTGIIYVI